MSIHKSDKTRKYFQRKVVLDVLSKQQDLEFSKECLLFAKNSNQGSCCPSLSTKNSHLFVCLACNVSCIRHLCLGITCRRREDGRCPVLSANFSFHRNIDHSFLCWSYIFSCSPQVHLLHLSFCWSIFHPVDLLSSCKKKLLFSDASLSIPRKSEHREQREDAEGMHTTDSQAFSRINSASGLLWKIHSGVKDVQEML